MHFIVNLIVLSAALNFVRYLFLSHAFIEITIFGLFFYFFLSKYINE